MSENENREAADDLKPQDLPQQKMQALIDELMKVEKKQSGLLRAMMAVNVALTAGILIALIVLVPRTVNIVNNAQASLTGINQIIDGANTILEDADRMVDDANEIMKSNSSGIEDALNNFNSVDFETLNKAINDLADAVRPLAELSRLFG